MIPVLYDHSEEDFTSYGECTLSDCISCKVTEERNGKYECVLKYPISGRHYDKLHGEWIIKAKPNDTSSDQAFRIYKISKPINGIVTVYAQHISYDLAGIPVEPFSYESASAGLVLSNIISHAESFSCWTDYSETKPFAVAAPKSIRSCLGGSEDSVLSRWNGEFEWDNFTVKLHRHRGDDSGVVIEYGKNLTDITEETDNTSVYSAVLPYAVYTDADQVSHLVMLQERTVPIEDYEIERNKVLIVDLSDRFEGEVTEEMLRDAAEQYIEEHDLGRYSRSISLAFYPMHHQPGYPGFLDRIKLCDTVKVRYTELGVEATAKVIETVYDTIAEKFEKITLGNAKSNIIGTIADVKNSQSTIDTKINLFPAKWQRAIDAATALITGQTGGIVVLNCNGQGKPSELLIMDDPDISLAENIWRWNMGGLGFSSHGYEGPYDTAITSDGHIVADFIDTGTLTANIITAGTLSSLDGTSWWDLESGEMHLSAVDTITQEVSRLGTSLSGEITEVKEDLQTTQDSIAGRITDAVEERLKDEQGNVLYATKSELTQKAESLTASFTAGLNGINSDLDNTLRTFFEFSEDGLIVGKSGSDIRLKIINDEIDFISGDEEKVVAYFSDNKLYVTDAEFLTSITIGNFAFTPRANGNLSFGKVR